MPINKVAADVRRFRRTCLHFGSARAAFKAWLCAAELGPREEVLLPAYVGRSPREGSGVLDPVAELALPHRFYSLDDRLAIDLASIEAAFRSGRVRVLVLIHYFGRIDPAAAVAAALARRHGALVLEDEAHAMLTDLVGGASGRLGDACIFSLHKLLPVTDGGTLVLNRPDDPLLRRIKQRGVEQVAFEFDLAAIAARRRSNYAILDRHLPALAGRVEPLWGSLAPAEAPQTYPLLVPEGKRDALYEAMNARGFGVVSLYHTLVEQVTEREFPGPCRVSRRILNLPVHQDVQPDEYASMMQALATCIAEA